MSFRPLSQLAVSIDFGTASHTVGKMVRRTDGRIFFEDDPSFLSLGLEIAPLRLKLDLGAHRPTDEHARIFDGLFGVFADSLPDGWGLLLMSRNLRRVGLKYEDMTPLDRLAYVGDHGMGALKYHPIHEIERDDKIDLDLAALAVDANKIQEGDDPAMLSLLAELGGSAGGARPKVLVGIESGEHSGRIISGIDDLPNGFEHWLVKFHAKIEGNDAGAVEWAYAQTAVFVGITMEPTHLFVVGENRWFGTRRFDRRNGGMKLHTQSAAALLHANFRAPAIDYETLLKLTSALTKRDDDLRAAFRLAAFNVVFHNRDDHAKNFSFLMDPSGNWRLSPAYDLTYSQGPGGQHMTAVVGEGRTPGREHLLKLADSTGISRKHALEILEQVDSGRAYLRERLKDLDVTKHPIQSHKFG